MRSLFLLPALLLFTGCASKTIHVASSDQYLWSVCQSCDAPESAYYDPESGVVFVSNIVGKGDDKDGKGWIQTYTPEGKILKEKWVSGLNGPKGMRSHGGKLWVSDIDRVLRIDIPTARIERTIRIRGAKFLNDVAVSKDGRVFVSDTISGTIHVIENNQAKTFVRGAQLESPNGLLVEGDTLYVAAWGVTTDWTTRTPGRLYQIDLKTRTQTLITPKPLGNLDGLERTASGDFLVSDWAAGKVYRVSADGKAELLFRGMQGAADIGYIARDNVIIIPRMGENKITSFKL